MLVERLEERNISVNTFQLIRPSVLFKDDLVAYVLDFLQKLIL